MTRSRHVVLRRVVSLVAVAFGIATLAEGGRVLAGVSDPGYIVFRPLLVFNVAMGGIYIIAGIGAWRSAAWSARAAGAIFALNTVVFMGISVLYTVGSGVAVDSVRAMAFRCAVWLALFIGLRWVERAERARRGQPIGR